MIAVRDYRIRAKIYESASSTVYRATRNGDDRPVILKILNEDYPTFEELTRYRQEYAITRALGEIPGVIGVYGLEKYENTLMMIVEDFGADSLKILMKRRRFHTREVLRTAIRIAEILGELHSAQVIHKDVNPSNIVHNPSTGQLKIIDFGIATALSRENPVVTNPDAIEGTLAYLSPEQTGRMNRCVDYRTDYYSFGATLYEMLVGATLFQTRDSLDMVHYHIAKLPVPPREVNPAVPEAFSRVIMKLLAKNAEDRYQSAVGIRADLERCLHQLNSSSRMESFPLGTRDIPDRFQIPQKLYGRSSEIELLMSAFEEVSAGGKAMMLVSGLPGIGKTSLVREIHKPVTRQKSYFVSGKFEQFNRNIPYSAVISAFRELIRQILTEKAARLASWRKGLLDALGANAQIVIEVVPEVQLILGPQPAVERLDPSEAEHRFHWLVLRFVRVFCRQGHPLVLFLDDLQWADSASLKLLHLILTDPETQGVFFIAAYRDTGVDAFHPLTATLDKLREEGVPLKRISLGPLNLDQTTALVADTLARPEVSVRPLATLVFEKTAGNPFFCNEFLKSIHEENLLTFDRQQGLWEWDIHRIETQAITANVVELMSRKILKFRTEVQEVLKLAACVGNRFDLETLALVFQASRRATLSHLKDAISEGLVIPLGSAWMSIDLGIPTTAEESAAEFKFSHDRIQQAAYQLVPEEARPVLHKRIADLLISESSPSQKEEQLFHIVNHLNASAQLPCSDPERYQRAELNLLAGRKAKASSAYGPALQYLTTGIDALDTNIWQTRYDLALALYLDAAEAAFLCTDFEAMEAFCATVLEHARDPLDRVRVYEVRIQAATARYEMLGALKIALEALELLGLRVPRNPTKLSIVLELIKTRYILAGKGIETLAALPEMTDVKSLLAIRIMSSVAKAAYAVQPELMPVLALKGIALSVRHGNAAESAMAYASYGIILASFVGDIEGGHQFGRLALRLAERFGSGKLRSRVPMIVTFFIKHWKEHYGTLTGSFLEIYQSALETGNPEDAATCAYIYCTCLYRTGRELTGLDKEMASYSDAIRRLKQESALRLLVVYRQTVQNLLGQAPDPTRLVGAVYDEDEMLPFLRQAGDRSAVCVNYVNKLQLCYLFGELAEALECASLAEAYLDGVRSTPAVPVFYFYDSLTRLASYGSADNLEKYRILRKVKSNQKKMKRWAAHGPMNYLHKYELIEAERHRVLGRDVEASKRYDRAIALARQNDYLNEEALAKELASKFHEAGERLTSAKAYMLEARYCYEQWGAAAKVKDLEDRHHHLLGLAQPPRPHVREGMATLSTVTSTSEGDLDLAWVMKASHAVSGEIVLTSLLDKCMQTVLGNAGAQKGFLILESEGKLVIEAAGTVDPQRVTLLKSVPVEDYPDLSLAVVNFVARTMENVVLNETSEEGGFANDDYVRSKQPKSILCIPLIHQGKLTGILYLENNLVAGAFTPRRVEMLQLLASQAAISIENARLYEQMEHLVANRTAELQASNEELKRQMVEKEAAQQALYEAKIIAEAANRAKSEFLANMSHELRTPLNAIIGFSEILVDQLFGNLNERQFKYVEYVLDGGRHLLHVINDILDLAKIESGKTELHLGNVHLPQLLQESLMIIEQKALSRGLDLDLCIAPELSDTQILADEVKLKQVLFNLLSNATKFTPEGGRITLKATKADTEIIVAVSDTGAGVDPKDQQRIFREFEQVDSSYSRHAQGTGLGLALARRLVELHGGRIWVESAGQGRGSTFGFALPEEGVRLGDTSLDKAPQNYSH